MIGIAPGIELDEKEISLSFVRSGGPGGQNVNKVATAAVLRFNIPASSSLPSDVRLRLLALSDSRITSEGEVVIHADRFRTQAQNRTDAIARLVSLIARAATPPRRRKKTRPSRGSSAQRIERKRLHGEKKQFRGRVADWD